MLEVQGLRKAFDGSPERVAGRVRLGVARGQIAHIDRMGAGKTDALSKSLITGTCGPRAPWC